MSKKMARLGLVAVVIPAALLAGCAVQPAPAPPPPPPQPVYTPAPAPAPAYVPPVRG
jgi:hypothetical protein